LPRYGRASDALIVAQSIEIAEAAGGGLNSDPGGAYISTMSPLFPSDGTGAAAHVQAGYGTLGSAGHVFKVEVNLLDNVVSSLIGEKVTL
jgi:hypothetical protein